MCFVSQFAFRDIYIKHTLSNKRENVELTFLRSVTIVMQFKMVAGFSHLAIR